MAERSARLAVNPAVLVWARETAGVTVEAAGVYLGQSESVVHRWESGEEKPTVSGLKRLATFYGRPLATLLLSEPRRRSLPRDFRVVAGSDPLTRDSLLALRKAAYVQYLFQEIDSTGPNLSLQSSGTDLTVELAEKLAIRERERLGVSVETQSKWRDEYHALREWRSAVEDAGVVVLQASMNVEEIRGFALAGPSPVICLNMSDYPNARVFTLFHEYAHLLVGGSGICDADAGPRSSQAQAQVERFCNRFAGALLVPRKALIDRRSLLLSLSGPEPPSDSLFSPHTSRFRVSRQVLWYRMKQLDLIDQQLFDAKWAQWAARNRSRKPSGDGGGGMTRVERAIHEGGHRLIATVVAAESRGDLGTADALNLLRIKTNELRDVAAAVGR